MKKCLVLSSVRKNVKVFSATYNCHIFDLKCKSFGGEVIILHVTVRRSKVFFLCFCKYSPHWKMLQLKVLDLNKIYRIYSIRFLMFLSHHLHVFQWLFHFKDVHPQELFLELLVSSYIFIQSYDDFTTLTIRSDLRKV